MHVLLALLMVFTMTDSQGVEQYDDLEPVTASASSLVDVYGDSRFGDVDDPAQETWTGIGPGPALQTVFSGGLTNGDFLAGPREPANAISDENRIPGWSYVVVQGGGNITAYWVDSATSPSGKAIEWRIRNAVADDEVYLEQVIAVSPRQRLKLPILRSTIGGDTDSLPEVRIQYLMRDGTTTGSESVGVLDPAFLDPQDVYALAGIPSDARLARIRIVMTTAGTVASDTVTFHEAWAGEPRISYETWSFGATALTGTGALSVFRDSVVPAGGIISPSYITPDAGQGTIGWVENIAVTMLDTRTAGTATFQLAAVDTGGPTTFGPVATIDGTDTLTAWSSVNLLDTSSVLTPDHRWGVLATCTGFTPTGANVVIAVRVAFVQLATTTGGNAP